MVGSVRLRSGEVLSAECWPLLGERAFSTLISHAEELTVDVRAHPLVEELGSTPLGTLDALLLREVLSGRIGAGGTASWLQKEHQVSGEEKRDMFSAQMPQDPLRLPMNKGREDKVERRPFWKRLLGQQ